MLHTVSKESIDKARDLADKAGEIYLIGETHRAETLLREAIELDANSAEAHSNLGMVLMSKGDYRVGWKEYDWRWDLPMFAGGLSLGLRRPFWAGETSRNMDSIKIPDPKILGLIGLCKTPNLFVHCEQGFGDSIQFIRYALAAQQMGMEVTLSCQPELYRLFQQLPLHHVQSIHHEMPKFDYHCPLLSMPLAMMNLIGVTFPFSQGYLAAPERLKAIWSERIGKSEHMPNVGICWKGASGHALDRVRSVFLTEILSAQGLPRGRYFSFQHGGGEEAKTHGLIDHTEHMIDFADTAAAIACMDLMICVDSSVAHLCAAMGKLTNIILPAVAEWRWGTDGMKTPWYDHAFLHRREKR